MDLGIIPSAPRRFRPYWCFLNFSSRRKLDVTMGKSVRCSLGPRERMSLTLAVYQLAEHGTHILSDGLRWLANGTRQ